MFVSIAYGQQERKAIPGPGYEQRHFCYDERSDTYRCPEGQVLSRVTRNPRKDRHGRKVHHYRAIASVCKACRAKGECTDSEQGRMLKVSAHRKEMEAFTEKMESERGRAILSNRKSLVEHPFGTVKRTLGYEYFLVRGLEKVRSELDLICTVYNMKRVFSIFPMTVLLNAL